MAASASSASSSAVRDPSRLAAVLANPAIWRGSECAPEPEAIASGFHALDAVLPGGGWPRGALTEILLAGEGIGEIRLTLPALAQLTVAGRDVVWIEPPWLPYAPALAGAGLDLSHLAIVRGRDPREALWAYEQALRAPECGAAFAWLRVHDERLLRRLQVAARDGRTWGVLWRRPGERSGAMAAALRLGLAPSEGALAVHVLKRRGGEVTQAIRISVRNPVADVRDRMRGDSLPAESIGVERLQQPKEKDPRVHDSVAARWGEESTSSIARAG